MDEVRADCYLSHVRRLEADEPGPGLTPDRRAVLRALAATMLPHRSARLKPDVASLVERRLEGAPPDIARDLCRALDVLGARLSSLVVAGRATPFAAMGEAERERVFEAWGTSGLPIARTVHQALRRLVLSTWYGTAEARAELGVRPPLAGRAPAVPWEGPLPGAATRDDEPVARQPDPRAPITPMPSPRPVPGAVTLGGAVQGDLTLRCDAVIVGSGAGGAVAATRLAEAGREVVIIEEGDYLHAPDFTDDEGALMPRLFADQAMRATVDASVLLLQGATAGGGTTVNWMLMFRAPDHVLEEWERTLGIAGWSARELAPAFDRIEREVHARQVPSDAHAPSNRIVLDGARALGWHATETAINAQGCVRAGTCSLGCRYDAKQSALVAWLPRAFAAGARMYTGARVDRIELVGSATGNSEGSPRRKAVHATVRDAVTGETVGRLRVEAPIVMLAAGAVGTPAILERSGLGGGGVGRYLRLHPTTGVMGRYGREMYPLAGIPQSVVCDEFSRRDANGYGFWIECPALQPALASAALSGFGAAHLEDMRALANTAALIVLVRDGSGEDGSLGSVWVDRAGRTRVRYRLGAADRANLAAGVEATARLHLAAGAQEVVSLHTPAVRVSSTSQLGRIGEASYAPNRIALFSAHVNGTCRMGVRPATSGTDPDGQRHGVAGLYVCDGSLLPTSLGVNPQETIMALASVVAERVVEKYRF